LAPFATDPDQVTFWTVIELGLPVLPGLKVTLKEQVAGGDELQFTLLVVAVAVLVYTLGVLRVTIPIINTIIATDMQHAAVPYVLIFP